MSKGFWKTRPLCLHRGQRQACAVSKFDLGFWSGHDAASQTAAAKHGASFKARVACLDNVEMHVCFHRVQTASHAEDRLAPSSLWGLRDTFSTCVSRDIRKSINVKYTNSFVCLFL